MKVTFKDVTMSYDGKTDTLKDLNFTIPDGTLVSLLGPSGGGKTTLANLISRFFDADEGEVFIGGVNVQNIDKTVLMNTVSFVFQNSRLIKGTILDNVKMARPDAANEEVLQAIHKAQCDDIIKKFPEGINTVIGTHGTYLSGGEAQRIALARAILKDAPIVLLDEATAYADPENEGKILASFSQLIKGKTVMVIAHRLSTIRNADQICVMHEGKIVERGTHDELIAMNRYYKKLVDMQKF